MFQSDDEAEEGQNAVGNLSFISSCTQSTVATTIRMARTQVAGNHVSIDYLLNLTYYAAWVQNMFWFLVEKFVLVN